MKEDVGPDMDISKEKTPVKKNFLLTLWQNDKFTISVVLIFLAALLLSNAYGYRICNCSSTDKWEPGSARTTHAHGFYGGGVNHK